MAAKPPRGPQPLPATAQQQLGWEQDEEVARRLLDDMKRAEVRDAAAARRAKAESHAVAEAHAAGQAVERPWEQEEEVYRRLQAEMAELEKRGFGRAASRGSLAPPFAPPRLRPGEAPPLPHLADTQRAAPPNRTKSVQAAIDHPDWEQEEEVYQRLAAELAELESRGVGRGGVPAEKWIPKGPKAIARSPSTEAQLAHPPWEQEQEVYERLVHELVALENRADARLDASRRGGGAAAQHPPLEADQKAYEALEKKLREMEAREDAPPAATAMRRSTSRGALLPAESGHGDAAGVHQRL